MNERIDEQPSKDAGALSSSVIPKPPKHKPFVAAASSPPTWIKPQLTRLVDDPPTGDDWLHEIKYDGYRMHAHLDGARSSCLPAPGWTGRIAIGARSRPWARCGSSRPISMASCALSTPMADGF